MKSKKKPGFLVVFHTPSNAGYAMTPLERTFFRVARSVCADEAQVFFAFKNLDSGNPQSLPAGFTNVMEIDQDKLSGEYFSQRKNFLAENNVVFALCFDLQVRAPLCNLLRAAGVKKAVSYWGATISSENTGLKLLLKKLEVLVAKNKPDIFVFESEAMRYFATHGRGISKQDTRVIPTGVDTDKFNVVTGGKKQYLKQAFNIQEDQFVVFYSGHMEHRKGVHVIVKAATELVDARGAENFIFLICGNRKGEETRFLEMLAGKKALNNIIFGGYRTDLSQIMPECDVGVIASVGWDSFPMSSLEMAACGLPVVASRLHGLVEVLDEGQTGMLFEPGNAEALSDVLQNLQEDVVLRQTMSRNARARIEKNFSTSGHENKLTQVLAPLYAEAVAKL